MHFFELGIERVLVLLRAGVTLCCSCATMRRCVTTNASVSALFTCCAHVKLTPDRISDNTSLSLYRGRDGKSDGRQVSHVQRSLNPRSSVGARSPHATCWVADPPPIAGV